MVGGKGQDRPRSANKSPQAKPVPVKRPQNNPKPNGGKKK